MTATMRQGGERKKVNPNHILITIEKKREDPIFRLSKHQGEEAKPRKSRDTILNPIGENGARTSEEGEFYDPSFLTASKEKRKPINVQGEGSRRGAGQQSPRQRGAEGRKPKKETRRKPDRKPAARHKRKRE